MAAGGHPGREMDVVADVALPGQERKARVQAETNSDRARLQRVLSLTSSFESALRCWEGVEEGVSLRVHLDAVVRGARLADHPPMLGQCPGVGLFPQLVQQPGRALHVREEEGDGAGGEVATHHRIR